MTEPRNPLHRLEKLGQSVWLDYIERGFVTGGKLAALVREDGVSGLTSNPAIFHQAMAEEGPYRQAMQALAAAGKTAEQVYEALTVEDIRTAADALLPMYQSSGGGDGFVSLEVSPHLAHDPEGTFAEAQRLWSLVERRNLMIKVPGTIEAVPVIQRLIAGGINVNITLLFSVDRYAAVAEAYLAGLEQRASRNQPVNGIASVASFFLSRIDTLVDKQLGTSEGAQAKDLQGECAIANARLAYAHYVAAKGDSRWLALEAKGAGPQRLLWASTSTKNPAYSDVKYVDALIGPETVTTLPLETLIAYRDHGDPALRLQEAEHGGEPVAARETIRSLAKAGVDLDAVTRQLENEGIKKFVEPYEATMAMLREKLKQTSGAS